MVKAVFKDVCLHLQPQQLLTILGESGWVKQRYYVISLVYKHLQQGKSKYTTNVFSDPTIDISPAKRGVGLVFQDMLCFQH